MNEWTIHHFIYLYTNTRIQSFCYLETWLIEEWYWSLCDDIVSFKLWQVRDETQSSQHAVHLLLIIVQVELGAQVEVEEGVDAEHKHRHRYDDEERVLGRRKTMFLKWKHVHRSSCGHFCQSSSSISFLEDNGRILPPSLGHCRFSNERPGLTLLAFYSLASVKCDRTLHICEESIIKSGSGFLWMQIHPHTMEHNIQEKYLWVTAL